MCNKDLVTLDEFCTEMHNRIEKFRCEWIIEHKKSPDMWPLEIDRNNSGIWFEQFTEFDGK